VRSLGGRVSRPSMSIWTRKLVVVRGDNLSDEELRVAIDDAGFEVEAA